MKTPAIKPGKERGRPKGSSRAAYELAGLGAKPKMVGSKAPKISTKIAKGSARGR